MITQFLIENPRFVVSIINPCVELSHLVNLGIFMNVDPPKETSPPNFPTTKKIPELTQTPVISIYMLEK